jgi:preprotein translocase subunit SecY
MVVSRGKTPSAQETFTQMAQAAGLRGRVLVTIGLLFLVRLGIYLPIPGINRPAFAQVVKGNQFLGVLDYFSGNGISALGIFALGIIPFINASIILQLLTAALPSLERLQKDEGEAGRRKISQITRYVALGWAIIQSTGFAVFVNSPHQDPVSGAVLQVVTNPGPWFIAQMVLALTAGAMFVMWVSELITERGIGNGASLLIFLSIVSGLPNSVNNTINFTQGGGSIGGVVLLIASFLVMIVGIVCVQEGSRRIPIVYARRQVGRRMYREQTSYLPLRLNQGGVMPIIFASSVLLLPSVLRTSFPNNATVGKIVDYLSPGGSIYPFFFLTLIVFFSYFYSSLVMNPVDVSQNLKKSGASIPGIRPGRATTEYLEKVLNRLTILGAIFLGILAIVPTLIENYVNVRTFNNIGATSLLILVGVAIDTAKQIQTYVISQRYEGMVKD